MWLSETQKIGVGLLSFGLFFIFLGILLLFDAALIAMGNILFVVGGVLVIGPQKSMEFCFQTKKWRGTLCFCIGLIMVFLKWRVIGLMIEVVGFINLFGDFFPIILRFLRSIPFVGTLLNFPFVARLLDRVVGMQSPA
ncbi:Got1-domain-containing protein [Neoconidiobolus thromboides FSU 785]|nr:Got1-domain-containing protein [Neoconidiobolus thromboides FSU 785]